MVSKPPVKVQMAQQMDPMHKLSFHMNDFLASKEGQKLTDTLVKNKFPDVHQAIQNQVKVHNQVIKHLGSKKAISGGSIPPIQGQ